MRSVVLITGLFLLGGCGGMQTSQILDEESAFKEIMKMERRLTVSIKRKDIDALNQIWADEYLGIAPTGQVFTKSDLIAAIKSEVFTLESIEFDDFKLRLFGKMGILTGLAKIKGKS